MLCDFGLAKVLDDCPSGLTTAADTKYTPRYAAPELFANEGALRTPASDVWAWGCLAFGVSADGLTRSFGQQTAYLELKLDHEG